ARRSSARARLAAARRTFAGLARGPFAAIGAFAGRTFAWPADPALPAFAGGFAATFGAFAAGLRVRGLEAQAQQFFTQRIAHRGSCFSNAAAGVRCRGPRTAGYAAA